MARVKLKDGRTGDLLHIHEGVATVNVDITSSDPGGTVQVMATEIEEQAAGAELSGDKPVIPPAVTPPPPVEDPGMMALAGSAALLKPVFVQALIEALQHPAVADAMVQAVTKFNNDAAAALMNPESELGKAFSRLGDMFNLPDVETAKQLVLKGNPAPKKKAARKKKAATKK